MTIDAFILVGGRSTRMGRDKATLDLGGTTLAERAATTIRTALPEAAVSRVDASDDIYRERGPLGGLHSALTAAKTDWIFLLACDLPFVTSELIHRLNMRISADSDAVIPAQADGRLQPLCGFYRVKPCLAAAATLLESDPKAALRDLFKQVPHTVAAFAQLADLAGSGHFFLNLNTPDDLEMARRLVA
jgi:molybdenum cofactor guanylyltransferase